MYITCIQKRKFKPVKLCLKIDFVARPACSECLIYIYIYIEL